ncbi:MAG: hypothetical protein EOP45_13660 [Sphingobacteriaceae bacterium]|nr:MAG: hypothetical protein EOP45_13660 [Sphingobacteriaceae bacterium]
MKRDISQWNPCDRPQTNLYLELKSASVPVLSRWLQHVCELEESVDKESATSLMTEYRSWCSQNGFDRTASSINVTNFGIDIKKYQGIQSRRSSSGTIYSFDILQLKLHLTSMGHSDSFSNHHT